MSATQILDCLKEANVLKIEKEDERFVLTEARDDHNKVSLTRLELLRLSAELLALAGPGEDDSQDIIAILTDQNDVSPETLPVRIEVRNGTIYLRPEGYGDLIQEGIPALVELYEGQLRVVIWADINEEEPQVIILDDAKETNRKPE